jgi:hypothetical protein
VWIAEHRNHCHFLLGLRFRSQQELVGDLKFSARLTISESNASSKKVSLTSENAVRTSETTYPNTPFIAGWPELRGGRVWV